MPTRKDLEIVEVIRTTPNVTVDMIHNRSEIPLSTIHKRISRLREEGVLSGRLSLSHRSQLFPWRAFISIDFDLSKLRSKEFGYSNQKEFVSFFKTQLLRSKKFESKTTAIVIEDAEIILGGREDAFAIVGAKDKLTLCDFVTEIVRNLPGVKQTNTAALIAPEDFSGEHDPYDQANLVVIHSEQTRRRRND
jgi:DNA-binding Lrp family transcriptional regulator